MPAAGAAACPAKENALSLLSCSVIRKVRGYPLVGSVGDLRLITCESEIVSDICLDLVNWLFEKSSTRVDGSFGMCFLFSWIAAVGRLEPKVAVNCCGPYPWEKIEISCTDMWVIQGLLWPVSHSHMICICMYLYVYVCICMYLYVSECMYLFVSVCICLYLYVSICICMYLYVSIRMYLHVSICIYMYLCVSICIFMYLFVSVCIYVSMRLCIYVCMSVCLYVSMIMYDYV